VLHVRLTVLAAVLAATPVMAAPEPLAGTTAAEQTYLDYMNQKVCEKIIVTGSRLGVRRVCATRAEWAARRLEDRQAIDTLQTRLCAYTHNSGTGKPTC
jgi:hypothetical protein